MAGGHKDCREQSKKSNACEQRKSTKCSTSFHVFVFNNEIIKSVATKGHGVRGINPKVYFQVN
jgi:hypothetical protein